MSYVSDVKITISDQNNGIIGFATAVLHNSFFIGSIAIWKNEDGLIRITYPTKGAKQKEIFHPLLKELHQEILDKVIASLKGATS